MVAPGVELGTPGTVARNSDHWTTETILVFLILVIKRLFFCSFPVITTNRWDGKVYFGIIFY
jgi:hypothetical protein